jgi:hypothetical protein
MVGIVGIPRRFLLDTDECGIYLNSCNRKYGKGYVSARVREVGPYGHTDKWTLIMTISPTGFRHVLFRKVSGTTAYDFYLFIERVILRVDGLGIQLTFLWDNLSSHSSDALTLLIYNHGHRIIARPAYRPEDGPIEYVFNYYECRLRDRLYFIRNEHDLVRNTYNILSTMRGFDNYFRHCGY